MIFRPLNPSMKRHPITIFIIYAFNPIIFFDKVFDVNCADTESSIWYGSGAGLEKVADEVDVGSLDV